MPLGTIRYGSNAKFREQGGYFLEDVRRSLLAKFGEKAADGPNSVYAGGLWVRTSMDPKMQDAAAQALRRLGGGMGYMAVRTGARVVPLIARGALKGALNIYRIGEGG